MSLSESLVSPSSVFSKEYLSNLEMEPLEEHMLSIDEAYSIIENEDLDKLKSEAAKTMHSMCQFSMLIDPTADKIRKQLEEKFEQDSQYVYDYFLKLSIDHRETHKIDYEYDLNMTEVEAFNDLKRKIELFSQNQYTIKSIIKYFSDLENKFPSERMQNAISLTLHDIAAKLNSCRLYLYLLERSIDLYSNQLQKGNANNSIVSVDVCNNVFAYLHKDLGLISPFNLDFEVYDDSKIAFWNRHIYVFTPSKNRIEFCKSKLTRDPHTTVQNLDEIIPLYKILATWHDDERFYFVQQHDTKILLTCVRKNLLNIKIDKVEKEVEIDGIILGAFFLEHRLQIYTKNGPMYLITIDGVNFGSPQVIQKPISYYPLAPTLYYNNKYISFLYDNKLVKQEYNSVKDWTIFIPCLYKSTSNESLISKYAELLLKTANSRIQDLIFNYKTTDELLETITQSPRSKLMVLVRIFDKALNLPEELRLLVVTMTLRMIALNLNAICLQETDTNSKFKESSIIHKIQLILQYSVSKIGGLPIYDSVQIFLLIVFRFLYSNPDFVTEVFWNLPCITFNFKPTFGPQTALRFGYIFDRMKNDLSLIEQFETNFPLFIQLANNFGLEYPLKQFITIYVEKTYNLFQQNQKEKCFTLLKIFAFHITAVKSNTTIASTILDSFSQIMKPVLASKDKNYFDIDHSHVKVQNFEEFFCFSRIHPNWTKYEFTVNSNEIKPLHITEFRGGNGQVSVNGEELTSEKTFNTSTLNFKIIPYFECFNSCSFLIKGKSVKLMSSLNKVFVPDPNFFLFAYLSYLFGKFSSDCFRSIPLTEVEKLTSFLSEDNSETKNSSVPREFQKKLKNFQFDEQIITAFNIINSKIKWNFKDPPPQVIEVENIVFAAFILYLNLIEEFYNFANSTENVPLSLLTVCKSIRKIRLYLYNAFQNNDKDSPNILENFDVFSSIIHEKAKLLCYVRSTSDLQNSLQKLLNFMKSEITWKQAIDANKKYLERNKKLKSQAFNFIRYFEEHCRQNFKVIFYNYIDFPDDMTAVENLNRFLQGLLQKNINILLFYISVVGFDKDILKHIPFLLSNEKTRLFAHVLFGIAQKRGYKVDSIKRLFENDKTILNLINDKSIINSIFKDMNDIDSELLRKYFEYLNENSIVYNDLEEIFAMIGNSIISNSFEDTYYIIDSINFARLLLSDNYKYSNKMRKIVDNLFIKSKSMMDDAIIGILNVLGQTVFSSTSTGFCLSNTSKYPIYHYAINESTNLLPGLFVDVPVFEFSQKAAAKIRNFIIDANFSNNENSTATVSLYGFLVFALRLESNCINIAKDLDFASLINFASNRITKPIGLLYHEYETSRQILPKSCEYEEVGPKFILLRDGEVKDRSIIGYEDEICFFIGDKKIKRDGKFWMTLHVSKSSNDSILFGLVDSHLPLRFMGADLRGALHYPFLETVPPFMPGKDLTIVYSNRTFIIFSNGELQDQQFLYCLCGDFFPVIMTLYNDCEISVNFDYDFKQNETPYYILDCIKNLENPNLMMIPTNENFVYIPNNLHLPKILVGMFVRLKKEKYNGVVTEVTNSYIKVLTFKNDNRNIYIKTDESNLEILNESLGKIIKRASSIITCCPQAEQLNIKASQKLCYSLMRYILILIYNFINLNNVSFIPLALRQVFDFNSINDNENIFSSIMKSLIINYKSEILDYFSSSNFKSKTCIFFRLLPKLPPYNVSYCMTQDKPIKHTQEIAYDFCLKKISTGQHSGHLVIQKFVKDDENIIPIIHSFLIILKIMKNDSNFIKEFVKLTDKVFLDNDTISSLLLPDLIDAVTNSELSDKESIIIFTNFISNFTVFNQYSLNIAKSFIKFRDSVVMKFADDYDFLLNYFNNSLSFASKCDEYANYLSSMHNRTKSFHPSTIASFIYNNKHNIFLHDSNQVHFTFDKRCEVVDIQTNSPMVVVFDEINMTRFVEKGMILETESDISLDSDGDVLLILKDLVDETDHLRFESIYSKIISLYNQWTYDIDESIINETKIDSSIDEEIVNFRKKMLDNVKDFVIQNDFLQRPVWMYNFEECIDNYYESLQRVGYSKECLRLNFNRFKAGKLIEVLHGESMFLQFCKQIHSDETLALLRNEDQIWKAVFIKEGAIDVGGPMRESFTDICVDISNPATGVFMDSPDRRESIHGYTDELVINPYCPRHLLVCAGAIIGASCISNITFGFNLAKFVWRFLCGIDVTINDVFAYDHSFKDDCMMIENAKEEDFSSFENWSVKLISGKIEIIKNKKLTFADKELYLETIKNVRVNELRNALVHLRKGFNIVSPKECTDCLSPKYLEEKVRGKIELKPDDVKRLLMQQNGYDLDLLNKVLDDFDEDHLRKFLKFVTGVPSIPVFIIDPFINVVVDEKVDIEMLPTTRTCFYKLIIPKYPSVEILRQKLLLAIEESAEILH